MVKSNQHIHLSVYVSFSSSSYSIFRLFLPLSYSFSLSLTHFIVVSCSIIFLYHFSISLSFCSLSLYFYRMYLSVMCVLFFSLSLFHSVFFVTTFYLFHSLFPLPIPMLKQIVITFYENSNLQNNLSLQEKYRELSLLLEPP